MHDEEGEDQGSLALEEEENLKGLAGEALTRRQELNDLYE